MRIQPSIGVVALVLVLVGALALLQGPTLSAQGADQKKEAKKGSEAAGKGGVVKMRDPFRPLLAGPGGGEDLILPPGKRGLVIARLAVTGVVNTPEGMIAVVKMQGRDRAYFLREGDEVYKGRVRRITEDAVLFMEKTTDPFGTAFEREVFKQIPGSGANR